MQIPWYISAIGAALAWGVHYPLVDYALKRISLVTVLLLTALPILLLTPFFLRTLATDFALMRTMSLREVMPILAICVTTVLGTVLLFLSIDSKNATLASLIEISYPVFVALFAWLLFREIHLTPTIAVGAILVFAGVTVIIWNT